MADTYIPRQLGPLVRIASVLKLEAFTRRETAWMGESHITWENSPVPSLPRQISLEFHFEASLPGYVIYPGQMILPLGQNITALPLSML